MSESRDAREARELERAKATLASLNELLSRPTPEPYTHIALTREGREFSIHKSEAAAGRAAALVKGTVKPWTPTDRKAPK